jgi:hypothetical protein
MSRKKTILEEVLGPSARDDGDEEPRLGLETVKMSEVEPKPLRFLVDEYLPLGKLVLWAGDGGLGKSVMTLDLTACLTTGRPCLGLDYPAAEPCDVLLISCEDDPEDTIVPRLIAAGADRKRVHFLKGVKAGKGKKPLPFPLLNVGELEQTLADNPQIKLVVIDPAGAYVGATGMDDHKDSQLRALLGPLCELAARLGVTILLIKHVTKGVTAKAVQKVSGSSGYVNAVRAAYMIAPDPDDKERGFLMPVKNHLVRNPLSLAYRTVALDPCEALPLLDGCAGLDGEDRRRLAGQMFRVGWLGRVDVDPDAVVAALSRGERGPNKVARCADWLEQFLSHYAYPSDELMTQGGMSGFTFDNVKEAKVKLKPKGLRSSNGGRFQGKWWVGFGDPHDWVLRPPRQSGESSPRPPTSPHSPHSPHNGEPGESIVGKLGSLGTSVDAGETLPTMPPDFDVKD